MSIEKIPVRIYENDRQASRAVARRIAAIIRHKAAQDRPAVLGLATGHTPVNVYRELIRMHRQEGLDLSGVVTFNLDEYWPIDPPAAQSYRTWMHENLFKHVNIRPANIHLPAGDVPAERVEEHCRQYEALIEQAGGIDLQILGIGRSGHIGFNEPGSARDSRTRLVRLDKVTRKDAAGDFFGEENTPEQAITMGVGTILAAREVALLAFGEHKAPIVRRAAEGEVSPHVAASFLQAHPSAALYVNEAAAADLTRVATPWLVGAVHWDALLQRHAVIWLAQKVKKAILKLTDEDYVEHGLGELRSWGGGAYRINIVVFRELMETITGWPAGKDAKRRILILSPHPDDDVICMGGTMQRLTEQGHDVHVAYMVSGYLSVFDHDVSRYADFIREFNRIFGLTPDQSVAIEQHIDQFLRRKKPGDIDTAEIQAIKGLIRRTEAVEAAKYCGVAEDHMHFLDMPFYNTGRVQKLSIGPEDVARVKAVLEQVTPEMVFAAGDLSDPHGTHRLCLEAALSALEQYTGSTLGATSKYSWGCDADKTPPSESRPGRGLVVSPTLWYYRGAWQEWSPEQIDMAVPLSPDELKEKRFAIFRHQSQKDRAMFPGAYDSREFWQRAEERNQTTARLYDELGLPEYHALEAFVQHPIQRSANTAAQLAKEE